MSALVEFSLKFRFVAVIVAVGLLFFGITQTRLRDLPLNILPEFSPPQVEIQVESLGLSAEEVEALITVPMEHDLLNGIPWLQTIRSESVAGLTSIVLVFQPGTDLVRARQMVTERMTQAVALPHVSKPPVMLQPRSSTKRGLLVGLSSKELTPIQMSVLARWKIQPRLMGVPGVANVSVWGQRDRQLQVQVDPQQLRTQGVTLGQVLETTGNALWSSSLSYIEASTPGTGGFVETSQQRLGVRHVSPITTAERLAQVPVLDLKKRDGTAVRLSDIGTVVEDHQPLIGDAMLTDGQGLILVIERFPWANTMEVTRGVEAAFEEMRPGLPGLQIDTTVFRPASFIELSLGNVGRFALIGGLLLLIVLATFLFDWRTVIVPLVAIPLSLVAGGLVLYLRGETINAMILAGFAIAVGVVVDDAIVDVENIVRRLRQHRGEQRVAAMLDASAPGANGHAASGDDAGQARVQSTASVLLKASLEVRGAIVFATLITALTILPIFFIGGLSGAFFQPLAISYGLAILASMIVALTITPALSLILLANVPVEQPEPPLARRLQRGYRTLLARLVQQPRTALAALAGVAVLGLATLPLFGLSLVPNFRERDLMVQLTAAPGTGQPEMSRIAGLVSQEVRSLPGIRSVGAHVGRAVTGDQVVAVNSAELWVGIDPAANYDQTRAAIEQVVRGYPGIHSDVQTYLGKTSGEALAGPGDPVSVRVYGEDWEVLRRLSSEVQTAIGGVSGIVDARAKLPIEEAHLEVEVDVAAAQRVGIRPGDVRRTAAVLLAGLQVGSLFEEQKVFDVVVWSTPATRRSLSSIADLMINTPAGGQVRLGDLATLRITPTPSVIRRDATSRYIDVVANVQGRDLGAVTSDVHARLGQVKFPSEYHAAVLDDYADRQAARTRLLVIALATLAGIFFVLQAAFNGWRLAALSFLTLPVALVGGLLAALVGSGGVLSIGSLIGFLAVFGIAARNSVMLIRHYQHLERHEGETFGSGLAVRGAVERLAPILMTACATGLAFLPLVVAGDIPGLEILHPMAIVVVGGLVTSTLLNLFVVPALFSTLKASPARDLELDFVPAPAAVTAGAAGD